MYCETCGSGYTNDVMDHFQNPRNSGHLVDADGEGKTGDPECGDHIVISIKVRNQRIEDIRFLVYGCAAAIATTSMTTELAKGKTLTEALNITDDDVANALGGLPENKLHCSLLGPTALKNAIQNYYDRISDFKKCLMYQD
ncbi:iron-sulfur cluster assembly scaffold protein [Sinanaerobacter chloroacetimidivorans]|uniref:Iron-sulfur cluster assembly scaffold protein n=1 Tax=Sinanaerobacter chloroacetimidivorans TaxID=2818044 RepID=A0A8J7W164_9FIRM|nr:iron-sulfur cluster assembly scaffold protein [Sinanaerobacter chloroacetimidivorans]MBR0598521.1 iron-sulfur cluster assembly scaffold protein [Sinanaerobacter chloroacetimidivorans]